MQIAHTLTRIAALAALSIGATVQAQDDRPNILLIIGDDMGYSDIGAFGSEVSTPNLDTLASQGMRFTNFHVGATCSPTRSLLLSGVDNHLNGMGNMHEFLAPNQIGKPGYEGHLNDRVVTIATIMRDAGYRTSMTGKWHLGGEPGSRPHDRGFDQTYALMQGAADNYGSLSAGKVEGDSATFAANGEITERPDGVHSNLLYTNKALGFIGSDRDRDTPFFAYLSFQTAHWPHQAPKEFVEKYRDVYAAGWDVIRAQRVDRLRELGVISPDAPASPRFPGVPAWDDVPSDQKIEQAYRMAAYAGMIEHMDSQIGRVFDHLKEIGEYDNTVIIFLTDNGPDFSQPNLSTPEWFADRYPKVAIDEIGEEGSYSSYGAPWAQVAAAHLSGFKTFSTEGGLRVPLIIKTPESRSSHSDEFVFVTDLAATILDLSGSTHPGSQYQDRTIFPMNSKSFVPLLNGVAATHRSDEEWVGYELMGNSALYKGDYKVYRQGNWLEAFGLQGTGEWRLYNLKEDPSELHDLSQEQPELFEQMLGHYNEYKERVGILETPADFNPLKMITGG